MPKTSGKTEIKVTCSIVPGKGTTQQRALWSRVWNRLITQAQAEAQNGKPTT